MGWTALLWAVLLAQPGWSTGDGVLGRIEVLAPQHGPRVVYRPMAAPLLVAVRLSVPVEEGPGTRGATRLLYELVRRRLEAGASAVGARIEFETGPAHAAYALVGPRESFEAMIALLRRAVARPAATPGEVAGMRTRLEREALAALELPGARIRVGLLAALFGASDTAGLAPVPDSLTTPALEWFWRRYYVPERMTAVVVGAVSREAAAEAFADWPAPPPPSPLAGPAGKESPAALPPPQSVSRWAGVGWSIEGGNAAALAVASALVTRELAGTGLARARAEVWWGAGRIGFVAIGSVLPGADSSAAPTPTLRLAIERIATELRAEDVAGARRALWHDMLFDARTPMGLASLIGRFAERTGDPHAAAGFLDALLRVDADHVRAALLDLLHESPAVVEVGP